MLQDLGSNSGTWVRRKVTVVEEEIRSTFPQNLRNLSNSDPQRVQHLQTEVRDSASTWPLPPQVRSSPEPNANNPTILPNDVF